MKILKLKNDFVVSKNDRYQLAPNYKNLENIKAMFELDRIVNGNPYTIKDVWDFYNEELVDEQNKFLSKNAR